MGKKTSLTVTTDGVGNCSVGMVGKTTEILAMITCAIDSLSEECGMSSVELSAMIHEVTLTQERRGM